jgi:hypothetical protein
MRIEIRIMTRYVSEAGTSALMDTNGRGQKRVLLSTKLWVEGKLISTEQALRMTD